MKSKKFIAVLLLIICLMSASCGTQETAVPECEETGSLPYDTFTYTHYSSGGNAEEYTAVILFEEANSVFTCYQIAFRACTCRDSIDNYLSVAYVELLNTKENVSDASVRYITFGENRGLWGDSNPNYYIADYTEEYMDEHFVKELIGVSKDELDGWEGYGKQLEVIEADTVAGASVSTSNITSMLRSLMKYHTEKYYTEK